MHPDKTDSAQAPVCSPQQCAGNFHMGAHAASPTAHSNMHPNGWGQGFTKSG